MLQVPTGELDPASDQVLGLHHRVNHAELALAELDVLAVWQHNLEVGLRKVQQVAQVGVEYMGGYLEHSFT